MTNEELYYLPASELLKHIQAEKERLIKKKIIKKSKELTPITEEEKPYDLPEEWEWVRLNEITSVLGDGLHGTPKYSENGGYYFINGNNLELGKINIKKDTKQISEEEYIKHKKPLDSNTIFISINGTLGNIAFYNNEKVILGKSVCYFNLIHPIKKEYIAYILKSPYFKMMLQESATATTIKNISLEMMRKFLIPLPPLYIQDQIVQKLEQLSKTKDSLLSHAESQLNYTKKMREALLQEAIRGELVPQDENDEPASILLEKIKTEKERLIKEKIIKKAKGLAPITEEEKPYELPAGWEWVRLGDVVINRDGERKPLSSKQRENIEKIYDYYGASGVIDKVDNYLFDKRLLLIGEDGANLITRSKPIAFFGEGKYWVNNHAHVLDCTDNMCIDYIEKYINAIDLKPYVTGTAQPKLNQEKLNSILIALPPLAEQERIVVKLNKLMVNCDQLEEKAQEIKDYTSKFFEASLKEAFMPE